MNILTFTYTKKDGSASKRVLVPSVVPNAMYEGTDISELNMSEQAMFTVRMQELHEAYVNSIKELTQEFDVNNRYRRFDPKLMSDVVKETI